jgi:hypothetical protein
MATVDGMASATDAVNDRRQRRLRRIAALLLLLLFFPALAVVLAQGGGSGPGTTSADPGNRPGQPGPVDGVTPPRLSADGDPLPETRALSQQNAIGAPRVAQSADGTAADAPNDAMVEAGSAENSAGLGHSTGAASRSVAPGSGAAAGTPGAAAKKSASSAHDPGWLQTLAQQMVPALGGAQYGPHGPMGNPKPGSAAEGATAAPGQVLEHPAAPDGTAIAGGIASGMAAPGRATPVAPAAPGNQTVNWAYQIAPGAPLQQVSSTITITAAAGADGRAPASVSTYDPNGNLLVSYPATAFVDAQGNTHVDAQGATVSGPMAGNWSPDSMAIDPYGYVHTLDDFNRSGNGWQN